MGWIYELAGRCVEFFGWQGGPGGRYLGVGWPGGRYLGVGWPGGRYLPPGCRWVEGFFFCGGGGGGGGKRQGPLNAAVTSSQTHPPMPQ